MKLSTFAATVCIALSLSTAAVAGNCDERKELITLALNIYHEARGEPDEGMRMVGEVTENRVSSSDYPDTICDVVYQEDQFAWVDKKNKSPSEEEAWQKSLKLAEELLNDNKESYDHLALFFVHKNYRPSWTRKLEKVKTVGNHTFYRM